MMRKRDDGQEGANRTAARRQRETPPPSHLNPSEADRQAEGRPECVCVCVCVCELFLKEGKAEEGEEGGRFLEGIPHQVVMEMETGDWSLTIPN